MHPRWSRSSTATSSTSSGTDGSPLPKSSQSSAAQIGVPCPWSKRLTDVVCSGLALILVAPMLLMIAALIKLSGLVHPEDRGPVLRSETRYSAGQPFRCYKFRVIKQAVLQREHSIG
ncbi:MAG TPA: hypothetical protein EYO90_10930, partial [Candidatus Latescibacteria bacterium]|nr:hypothetical protein [Candidatus Latescibacterota bacterium]